MSDIGFSDITFKEKPDITQVFLRQLDRNNQSALISPEIHESSTRQTCSNLPTRWRIWVEEQAERYTDYTPRFKYMTYQGHRIGSEEEPQLIDETKPLRRLDNGMIDWSDPNIYSPRIDDDQPPVDPRAYCDVVREAAELAKLTWNVDEIEIDGGDTLEYIHEYIERKKTPFLPQSIAREEYDYDAETEDEKEG